MPDHISRFVSNDGYALSFLQCDATAQLIGHAQHHLSGPELELETKGMLAALLMATRLKGRGMLSLQVHAEYGRLRDLRIDAMGMGYVRALSRVDTEAEEVLGNGTLTISKQLENSDQPYTSSVPINSDRLIHMCNAYLHSSEQVQAVICHDVRVQDNIVERANAIYLERLPAADNNPGCHLNDRYDEIYESKQDFMELPGGTNDEQLVADIFGDGQFEKLRQYDVQFYCPCSKDRYMDTLRGFANDQLGELVNEQGLIVTICDFCHSKYEIALDDVI